jgi:hypothetical protein
MMVISGNFIEHRVDEATGACSCTFTHPRGADGVWDVGVDTRWGALTEIPPIDGRPDIYVYWPFC